MTENSSVYNLFNLIPASDSLKELAPYFAVPQRWKYSTGTTEADRVYTHAKH